MNTEELTLYSLRRWDRASRSERRKIMTRMARKWKANARLAQSTLSHMQNTGHDMAPMVRAGYLRQQAAKLDNAKAQAKGFTAQRTWKD